MTWNIGTLDSPIHQMVFSGVLARIYKWLFKALLVEWEEQLFVAVALKKDYFVAVVTENFEDHSRAVALC